MAAVLFFSYIAFISTLSALVCFIDKTSARMGGARVRESLLCALGVFGGASCMLLTMLSIRHKTQHTAIIVLMSTASVIWTIAYAIAFCVFIL